ncbi:GNAT family N-acetyltransferase [Aeromonas media]|uniref:GNAT family N-acetyltransferase n=1 Tax=Aeromonas media TaxID=651 RepID=UPI00370AFE95
MIKSHNELVKHCRVYLRAFRADDYLTTHKWRCDDDVVSSLVGKKYFVSEDYEKKWIHDAIFSASNSVKLAVCLVDSNEHIGNVYLDSIDSFNQTAMFSLMIGNKSYWARGFGTEMTFLMLNYAFYEINLRRIYSYQLSNNIGSIAVHHKCGFKDEGVFREAVFKNGKFSDLNVMAILKNDFEHHLDTFYDTILGCR